MSTKIEWATDVWNPTTGCDKVSEGCKNCYAERMHKRLTGMKQAKYAVPFTGGVQLHWSELNAPAKFKRGARVFVNSMSDLFHDYVSGGFILGVFEKMLYYDDKTYIILTKRSSNMLKWFEWLKLQHPHLHQELSHAPHIWVGVSVENQQRAAQRIPHLLSIPIPTKILSCEPLLGAIDLIPLLNYPIPGTKDYAPPISWVICGGESGPGARPMYPDWATSLRNQCQALQIPFFFKQWGEYTPSFPFSSMEELRAGLERNFINQKKVNCQLLNPQGQHNQRIYIEPITTPHWYMVKTGKNHSLGNVLEGKTHLEFPTVKPVEA